MRKVWIHWAPGILLVVSLFVVGCTDKEEGMSREPGGSVTQAPPDQATPIKPGPSAPQEGATSPEPTQPGAAGEQKLEQRQKPS